VKNCSDEGKKHRYGSDRVTCVHCGAQRVGYRAQNGLEQRRAQLRQSFNRIRR